LIIAVLTAFAVIVAAGIVTLSVRDSGSDKTAKVAATPSPSPSVTVNPTPSPTKSPSPAKTPTPAKTPIQVPTHHAVTPTPGSQFPTSRASSTLVKSAHCSVAGGTQSVGGRSVIIDLPVTFPAPVIFDYHGGNQSAAQEHAYTGLGAIGARAGYIVVTPNGTNGLWNFTGTEQLPDDVAFTQAVGATLAFGGCSNGKLYTAGISDGADMAVFAACRIPEVRGVFVVAPSITPRGACTRKSFVEVHGTSDPVVPYSGSAQGSFGDTPSEAVSSRLPFWTSGCSGPTAGPSPAAGTTIQVWSCAGGRDVELATITNGGHAWPGAVGNEPKAGLGQRATWSAGGAAITFFAQH
jgi:polyhydroxybutyrate depolymerase